MAPGSKEASRGRKGSNILTTSGRCADMEKHPDSAKKTKTKMDSLEFSAGSYQRSGGRVGGQERFLGGGIII